MNTAAPPAIRVLFVLLPHSLTLDWVGPAEVLRSANSVLHGMGQPPRFELGFVGPLAEPVTSVGVCLSGVLPLPRLQADAARPTWVVLVGEPGERMHTDTPAAQDALHWLRGLRPVAGQLELVTVCAGAVLAAHAGLLARLLAGVQLSEPGQTTLHHFDQAGGIEGFFDEVHDAVFHHLHRHGDVGVAGDDDDGPGLAAQFGQAAYDLGSVHARHLYVGDDAGRGVLGQGGEELGPAGEAARAHAAPAQHPQEGVAHGGIVVDDEDGMIAHAVLAS